MKKAEAQALSKKAEAQSAAKKEKAAKADRADKADKEDREAKASKGKHNERKSARKRSPSRCPCPADAMQGFRSHEFRLVAGAALVLPPDLRGCCKVWLVWCWAVRYLASQLPAGWTCKP